MVRKLHFADNCPSEAWLENYREWLGLTGSMLHTAESRGPLVMSPIPYASTLFTLHSMSAEPL
jgi:hypothetical protein